MKELINSASDPIVSFPLILILFVLGLKYYRIVGTKKFAVIATLVSMPIYLWFMSDPNFFSIISFPDNIPISILIFSVTFFTWYAFYRAAINDERIERGLPPEEGTPEMREKVWVWPNLVYTELFCIIATTVFLTVWAIVFKAPLEEPANPTWAPNPAKAPWYFLGLQEMLVYFDPWMAGVVLPGLIIVGLIAIPFIDINPKGNGYYTFAERKLAITSFLFGWLVLWVYLIVIGTFLRGPNWTFYGPFEFWDTHKVVASNNVNLSEYFWIKGLGRPLPHNIFLRECMGIVLVFVYLFGFIPIFNRRWGKELIQKMGQYRYYLFIFLVLGMTSMPIKMFLRWLFNLKYIIAMPEFELSL
jgi:hypothetical protein